VNTCLYGSGVVCYGVDSCILLCKAYRKVEMYGYLCMCVRECVLLGESIESLVIITVSAFTERL